MSLISPSDQERLRESFRAMTRHVRLLFFTQTLDCDTCLQTREILGELPPLSDRIAIEEVNFVLEPDRAAEYGIDRVPSIAILYEDDADAGRVEGQAAAFPPFRDSRMRFLGTPAGYEFISLVHAILLAGGRPSTLTPENRSRIGEVGTAVTMKVFTTPTCPHCPRAVTMAHEMAFANPHIVAYAVEATEFPDLVARYQVNGVPKTVVNEDVHILGALPEDAFVEQSLGPPTAGG